MESARESSRRPSTLALCLGIFLLAVVSAPAQQMVTETRDPSQTQDEAFAKLYVEWTGDPQYGSPLVDHLPLVKGIPTPKEVLGYYIGAPQKLTYYADILKYYRALAAATPRVKVETIGKSDEGRELVVVWVSSEENLRTLQQNRDQLARLADPRGSSPEQIQRLIATTKPQYHLMGGLHSSETGPSEMLMELVYRLATETSPMIAQIRNNVYVSVTPAVDADGRDRNVDWFYRGLEMAALGATPQAGTTGTAGAVGRGGPPAVGPSAGRGGAGSAGAAAPSSAAPSPNPPAVTAAAESAVTDQALATAAGTGAGPAFGGGTPGVPYWGKYVFHDNNRDINLSLMQVRALTDWYFTAHPPIMHDLHEAQALMYTYSGGPPQNPNLDPLLFAELPWFSNWELAQMTKWGMPGVYTHAFMDGWSPGYVGSVAYNHNGMMKMYETQSGRDAGAGNAGRGRGGAAIARGPAEDTSPSGAAARAGGGGVPPAATDPGNARGAGGGGAGRGGAGRGAGGQGAGASAPGEVGSSSGATGRLGGVAPASNNAGTLASAAGQGGGRAGAVPTGRGGAQEREWYRGIPIPPNAAANFTRRDNTNYMQTGVLSSLQLTSMFPNVVVENFYIKTRNSIEEGKSKAPYGFVIPVQRDMTKPAALVRILRAQGIEVGVATADIKVGETTYPAGSYVIKRDQPYGRLAKNLLEKQQFPDSRLTTYDDSGWTMGLAMGVDVREISDASILKAAMTPVTKVTLKGKITGSGTAGFAVAHFGSNNMIAFRYKLKAVPMRIAEKSFTIDGAEFPAGSFLVSGGANAAAVRAAVDEFGLTAAAVSVVPDVVSHDADPPRIAIYSQWSQTQDLGWYRLTFDNFGIPYDLIYKERVKKANLKADYDVIIMAAQTVNRQTALAPAGARPTPYLKSDKYKFLGMYGETPDMSGGFGQEGVDAFAKFLESGGTLIAAGNAVRFPIDFGWARTVDTETLTGVTAQRPLVQSEIVRTDHPTFYGYADRTLAIKYVGGPVLRVGVADQANILARYAGGDASVLSGLMVGAENLGQRAFAADVPGAYNGKGRVILFTNNPVYRWQNHGEFNMMFNSILNWNDVGK